MDLLKAIQQIQTPRDLAEFIDKMRQDFSDNPETWENNDILSFFEAMAAWLSDAEGYYQNSNQPVPNQDTWRTVAQVMYASKIYE